MIQWNHRHVGDECFVHYSEVVLVRSRTPPSVIKGVKVILATCHLLKSVLCAIYLTKKTSKHLTIEHMKYDSSWIMTIMYILMFHYYVNCSLLSPV